MKKFFTLFCERVDGFFRQDFVKNVIGWDIKCTI